MNTRQADKQILWANHINAWKDGPLSQIAYCKKNTLSYSAFGYWRTRLNKLIPVTSTNAKHADFSAITIQQGVKPNPHFLLKINHRHSIEIHAGFNESLLVDLIRVIEGVG